MRKIYHSDTKVKKTSCFILVSPYLFKSTELQLAPPYLTLEPDIQGKPGFQKTT